MKKGFIVFHDKLPVVDKLNWEQKGRLFTALMYYSCGKELPEMDDMTEIVFMVMSAAMDECDRKYEETVEKRRTAGQRGGLAKASKAKQNLANASKGVANPSKTYLTDTNTNTVTDTDTSTETSTDTDTVTETEVPFGNQSIKAAKPLKHKYGEYQHVLLTDEEHKKLCDEYGDRDTTKCIRRLDEYIEEKGYKSKSHYLAIRRWVVDAIKKESNEKTPETNNQFIKYLKENEAL